MPICSNCGSDNPEGSFFCGACAAPLARAPAGGGEVRKTVTVIFCDVIGSTGLGERLDPESLRRVMARYFEAMKAVIERHGGTVEKFIGDAVMAVFGVPLLHEDDALRAVRSASEMRETLAGLNDELARDYGTTLELRIGVNTGEVVAGSVERLATGDAINIAARLEQAAKPGEVLLGEETQRLTRHAVEVEATSPLDLRGKAEPVRAFRLVAVRAGAPMVPRDLDGPMVGRERELRRLQDAFAQAAGDRSCQLFTVLGTAGVGKSRLAREFLSALQGARVVRGRCLSYGEGITYWPVVEVVKQLLPVAPGPRLARLGLDQLAAESILGLVGQARAPSSPEEIAWAVRKLLQASAAERPLIVVFEDIHWGEETFLDLVEHVADLARDAAILVLCLARPELLEARPAWGGGKLNATSVSLEPLAAAEMNTLMDQLLGGLDLGVEVRGRIADAAEGNPLFVEEMILLLRDSPGEEVRVPPSIQALLAARLDQVDPLERRVLEGGAVEGRVFHRGAVEALSAEPEHVPARLLALVRKDLVRPARPQLAGEDAFRFRHELIRDATYDALPKAARADLHERFSDWLEEHGRALVELDDIVGYHLEQAYRYRAELGPLDEQARTLGVRAGDRLAAAGRRALERNDAGAAAKLLGRALGLDERDHPAVSLRLDFVDALYYAGEHVRAAATAADAIARAEAADDRGAALRARLHAEWLLSWVDTEAASTTRMLELVGEAKPVFERAGDDRGLTELYFATAFVERARCHYGAAGAAEEQAAAYAHRAGDVRRERELRAMTSTRKLRGPTPVDEALAWVDAQGAEFERRYPVVSAVRAHLEAMQGRFGDARVHLAALAERMAELGLHPGMWMHVSCDVETLAGDYLAAAGEARRACGLLGEAGETGLRSTIACQLAQLLVALGRDREAEEALALGEELSSSDDITNQIFLRQARARLLARRGEHAAAEQFARAAVAIADETDQPNLRGDARSDLGEVLALARRPAEAASALEKAHRLYEQKGNVVSAKRARLRLIDFS